MTRSVTLAELDAYVSGLADDDADAFEEKMFRAALAGDATPRVYVGLTAGVRELSQRGTFGVTATERDAERMRRSGLRVDEIHMREDGSLSGETLRRSSDVLLLRIPLALEGVTRLDVEMFAEGHADKVVEDVPFAAPEGAVYVVCETPLAIEGALSQLGHRYVSVEGDTRRVIREVRFPLPRITD